MDKKHLSQSLAGAPDGEVAALAALDDYFGSAAGYAVLLAGGWGTGKTYFVDHVLASHCSSLGKDMCYVSLSGIADSQQLSPRLLAAAYGVSDKSNIKALQQSFNSGIRWVGRFVTNHLALPDAALQVDIASLSPWLVAKALKNKVVVFDDLERMKLDFDEFSSFVTQLVEKQACHVILVADRQRLMIKGSIFLENAEKVVGEVVYFSPNLKKIINSICGAYTARGNDFAAVEKGFISALAYFKGDSKPNLRSVQAACRLLARTSKSLAERWNSHPQAIENLSKFALIAITETRREPTIEQKAISAFSNPTGWAMARGFASVRRAGQEDAVDEQALAVNAIMEFCYDYSEVATFSAGVVASFLKNGQVSASEVLEKFDAAAKVLDGTPSARSTLFLVGEFWTLSLAELNEEAVTQLEQLVTAESIGIIELWTIVKRLVWFSEEKLIAISVSTIESCVRNKLRELVEQDTLDVEELRSLDSDFHEPTGSALALRDELKLAARQIEDRQLLAQIEEFLASGPLDFLRFVDALSNQWQLLPVLARIGPERLDEYVRRLPVDELRTFNSLLQSRYSTSNCGQYLGDEAKVLFELATMLEENVTREIPMSPKDWMLGHVIAALRIAATKAAQGV